jgi:hypothetical protein
VGTLATLIYFQFGIRQTAGETSLVQQVLSGVGILGQVFIAIAFGALFAGVYASALTAFIERVSSLLTFLQMLLPF